MSRVAKRARKKEHRDRVRAEQRAALRRRRAIRIAVVGAVLAFVAGVAVATIAGEGDGPRPPTTPAGDGAALPDGCERADRPSPDPPRFQSEPDMELEPNTDYRADVQTSCGVIRIDLLEDRAPLTVNSFRFLAREGFYDGLLWHRIEQGTVIQTGDPNGLTGTPPDGPGYSIPDELEAVRKGDYVYGVVGMANAGPDTGGSQFFIVVHDYEGALDGEPEPLSFPPNYTIFGTVERASWETLERLAKVPITGDVESGAADAVMPVTPVNVESMDIVERR